MRLRHKQQHCGPIRTLENTAIRLKITFESAFGSKPDLFSSNSDILQKEVSSGAARNSTMPPRNAPTIRTDVQNAAFCLGTRLQSRWVAPNVAGGTAEALSEFCFAVHSGDHILLLFEQSALRILADFW
jgi:hypothetical protein